MVASLAEAQSHNVPPETLLRHYRDIRDAEQVHKEAGMALARAKKAAKGDGIDLYAFKLMQGFAKLDSDEAEIRFRNLIRYAKWIEVPLGTQTDMWGEASYPTVPDKAREEQQEWAAGDAGLTAGRGGQERTANPHAPGSREHAAWDRSWPRGHKTWLAGQKKIADEMGERAGASQAPGGKGNGAAPEEARPGA